ncbi:MAG: hypothetical protein A2622_07925 [Bdellovibrionales bacterium RIFCSPHIGHO2_01_FULL_40_29]|nr:MAG: hypothetical protein A2622_07925 [Bdellovibrionales bacterium RIFCSPHIGHO2_01_FULL_40_29]OFZ33733.1 MAG: hypothetical protein A3D17_10015 [Bdellovibrionales bacterium RIFCSPHIGHO2_02_FULL_40_15]
MSLFRMFKSDELYLANAPILQLKLFALAATIIHPSFYFVLIFIDPNSEHGLLGRLGTAFLGSMAYFLYTSNRFGRKIPTYLVTATCSLILIHVTYLSHINDLSFLYAIGTFLAYCLIGFNIPTLGASVITIIVGLVGSATLFNHNNNVNGTMFFSMFFVTGIMIYIYKYHVYALTMNLIYSNETKSLLTKLLQSTIDTKDFTKTLDMTMTEFKNISWCRGDVPIALFVRDPGQDEWVYKKIYGCEDKSTPDKYDDKTFLRYPLATAQICYGYLFFSRKDSAISENLKLELLSSISNSLILVIDTHFKNEIFEKQRTLIVHSSKMITLGEMAGGIAHEINTPLASISMRVANLMSMKEDQLVDTPQFDQTIERIQTTVTRIANIIKGLRSFARDGTQDALEVRNTHDLIEETISLCRERFANSNVMLEYPGENSLSYDVKCQRVQINQVLLNILNNGFDAVCEIKDSDRRFVRIDVEAEKDIVRLKVTDGGPEIPQDIAKKIFQPFFTTKEIGKGTGLGLSISKGLVESQGGSLYLDSGNGQTCFVIELQSASQSNLAKLPG